ncbi:DUF805 domain-containing protein [Brevundimonas bacteroides]|uniref:DUF805 domain-containing protein n=1 Tax=Brevundimonas bacteroides TaxID=74311 RepID=UPI000494E4E4|nr:DUF805 domain-containing protein [Brevundimonas bacteroides]
MRGQILSFDDASGAGLISGDDGIRYSFVREAISPPASITPGLRVDFVPVSGEATNIMLLAAAPTPSGPSATPGVPVETFNFQHVLFSFNGRIRRQHFWIGWLICLGAGVVLGWIPLLGTLLSIALIWPNLAISVKRLHDMGHTGWLVAIPWIAGIAGVVAAGMSVGFAALTSGYIDNEDPAAVLAVIGPMFGILAIVALIQLGFLLWIGISEGQRGANRFGPNPKGE